MNDNPREPHVFIVRVWSESAEADPQWRATIEDVGTGRRVSSANLRDVQDFIRLRIGVRDATRGG